MTSKRQFDGERVRLGELVSAYSERNRDVRCTDVYSVTNSVGFTPSEEYFSKEVFSKDLKTYRLVKKGMIAYNPSRINVGSIALQDQLSEVVVSPLYVVFKTDESRLLPKYVLSFLKSKPGLDQIDFQSIGTVRNNLKFDALCRIEINLPSIQQQQLCVDRLERISAHIALLGRYCELLDTLVKSRFVEMFGKGIEASDSKYWPRLGDLADVSSGITKGRKPKTDDLISVPYMAVSNVKAGYIDWSHVKEIEVSAEEIDRYRLIPGDVLMTEGGDPDKLGRGAVIKSVPLNCIHQNHVFRVRLDVEKMLPEYLGFYLLQDVAKLYFLSCAKRTTGIATINKTQIKSLPIYVPAIEAQREFIDFVAKVDKPRFVAQQQIEKLQMLYDSLAQEYFG